MQIILIVRTCQSLCMYACKYVLNSYAVEQVKFWKNTNVSICMLLSFFLGKFAISPIAMTLSVLSVCVYDCVCLYVAF